MTGRRPGAGAVRLVERVPGGPAGRRLLAVQLVDKLGTGLFVSVVGIYLAAYLRLGATAVGLVLGAAGVGGVVGAPTIGRLVDRRSARGVLRVLHVVRAVAFAGYPFVHRTPALVGLSFLIGFCDRGAVTSWQVLVAGVTGTERSHFQGWSRATGNAAAGVGGLVAAAALAGGPGWLRAAILVDAGSFLACTALLGRVPDPRPPAATGPEPPAPSPAAGGSPWRDHLYRRFLAGESVLLAHDSLLKVGLPLWIVLQTRAPHATTGFVIAFNTALVLAFQIPISRRVTTVAAARQALPVAGTAVLAAAALLVGARPVGPAAAVAVLLAAVAALTLAEMVQSATSWELSLALAPAHRRGTYIGAYQMVRGAEEGAGPLVVAAACAAGPPAILAVGAASFLGATLERRSLAAPASPPARSSAPVQAAVARPSSNGRGAPQVSGGDRVSEGDRVS